MIDGAPGAPADTVPGETDFGRLLRGAPALVIRANGIEDVVEAIVTAHRRRLKLTARGFGSSQSGQSLSNGGLALDLTGLAKIGEIDPRCRQVTCEAGARWRSVIERTWAHGLLPEVLPLNLDLTVGGTLSVGGIGATSHRRGAVVSNVVAVEVVTAAGELVRCTREENTELFEAVLGGLGLFGVIVRATLALRSARTRVRTDFLLYDDPGAWLRDQRALIANGCDHLEAFCSASVQGLRQTEKGRRPFAQWFYTVQATRELSGDRTSDPTGALRPYRRVHGEELDMLDFCGRYDPRFRAMRSTGAWQLPHPWVECFVPMDVMESKISPLLDRLPLHLGDGHRLFFVSRSGLPQLVAVPETEEIGCFAVLPTGVTAPFLDEALSTLEELRAYLIGLGGKQYLSGWIGEMNEERWRAHHGPRYQRWLDLRRRFDPDELFGSMAMDRTYRCSPTS